MNQQIEQKANELLLSLIDKAQAGMEFAEAQIPDLVNQLLVWNATISAILSGIGTAMLIALVLTWRAGLRFERDASGTVIGYGWMRFRDGTINDDAQFFASLVSVFYVVGAVWLIVAHLDWLKIWIAPKLYLLEYAASLAR